MASVERQRFLAAGSDVNVVEGHGGIESDFDATVGGLGFISRGKPLEVNADGKYPFSCTRLKNVYGDTFGFLRYFAAEKKVNADPVERRGTLEGNRLDVHLLDRRKTAVVCKREDRWRLATSSYFENKFSQPDDFTRHIFNGFVRELHSFSRSHSLTEFIADDQVETLAVEFIKLPEGMREEIVDACK